MTNRSSRGGVLAHAHSLKSGRWNWNWKKFQYLSPHLNQGLSKGHQLSIESRSKHTYPNLSRRDSISIDALPVVGKFDLVRAYHQIPMVPEDIAETAVITPFGLFEFFPMPFGLYNAAQTSQRFMDQVFHGLDLVLPVQMLGNTNFICTKYSTAYGSSESLWMRRNVNLAIPLSNSCGSTRRASLHSQSKPK